MPLVPGLVCGLVAGAARAALGPRAPDDLATSHLGASLAGIAQVAGEVATFALASGIAAAAAPARRAPRLADAVPLPRALVATAALCLALGAVASLCAPFTLGLTLAGWAALVLRAPAAARRGARSFAALAESAAGAVRRPLATLAIVTGATFALALATLAEAAFGAGSRIGPVFASALADAPLGVVALALASEKRPLDASGPRGVDRE